MKMKLTQQDIAKLKHEEQAIAVKTIVILAVILVTSLWLYILAATIVGV